MTTTAYVQRSASLPDWNCTITLIFADDGAYAVLHEMCAVLGLASSGDQATRLKNHPLTAVHITDRFQVQTKQGKRRPYCLHIDGISKWLVLINPIKIRSEFQNGLLNFQAAVFEAAERILYGMAHDADRKVLYLAERLGKADVTIPADEESDNAHQITGILSVGPCPHCQHHLKVVLTEDGNYLQEDSA